jgi:lipoyl(octanoyl) transferase
MPVRPDLVECWVFRVAPSGRPEYLLIRRSDDRIFPGIWQPITGGIDPGESAPAAAIRELGEEVGLAGADIEVLYDLDQVGSFFDEALDAIVNSVMFAARMRVEATPRLSHEHVDLAWADGEEALRRSVWPAYRDSVAPIERLAADPELARWFELDPGGRRLARPPR